MGSIRIITGKFLTGGVILAALLLMMGTTNSAYADDCTRLGGALNLAGECAVSASVTRSDNTAPGGPYTILETLRITSTGHITVPPSGSATAGTPLTINITGQFIMNDGGKITGDVNSTTAGKAANITITASSDMTLGGNLGNGGAQITANQANSSCPVSTGPAAGLITLVSTGGNITTEDGSLVSADSSHCQAGFITITALPTGKIDIDGIVRVKSGATGTGSIHPGGGRITIKAGCSLEISDTGLVSSEGIDPGADLVHLEGCTVLIHGLVQSISDNAGHSTNVQNACNADNVTAHPIGGATIFTGCVEVWSGTTITIDNSGGNNGEVSADGVRSPNRAWIDLFAHGDITLIGNDTTYAVHANAANGGPTSNSFGGLITVKSDGGMVATFSTAIQANATGIGSDGGDVIVEASADVAFGTASIQAKGPNGDNTKGGHISARSFNGSVLGSAGGELNASGGLAQTTPVPGVVTLQGCGTIAPNDGVNYTGTTTPAAIILADACGGSPTIPVTLPLATCPTNCGGGGGGGNCQKSTVKAVLDKNTGRFPGNNGPDVTVRLDLNVGNPTAIQDALDTVSDSNSDGYIIVLVVKDGTGVLGGSRTESIVINRPYPQRFALIGCSVTLKDANTGDGLPTALIAASASSPVGSAENIFVMDLHGSASDVAGWKVENGGNGRYLRNVATNKNAVHGVWFDSNGNTMHNGNGINNLGDGIFVNGSGNLVDSSDAFGNGGNGVTVGGGGNKVLKVDAGDKGKGNGGDGVNVTGNFNTIQEVDAYSNNGNGIKVIGDFNQVLKNTMGDRNKANSLDGISLVGKSNNIQENEAYANGGNGVNASGGVNTLSKNTSGDRGDKANGLAGFLLGGGGSLVQNTAIGNLGDGFHLTTNGYSLKNNVSGGTGSGQPNGGCQYNFDVAGNTNVGGNKSNGVTLIGSPFPVGCE